MQKASHSPKKISDIPFSVLDLAPILAGTTAADTFPNSLKLAQKAEELGYTRFWLAEPHNMTGIASSATSVLIGYIAGGTKKIRVGSGGIMLPNHAPLVVAEQFGTLASLYPNRIDLGLGRAPGTDQLTAMALRRHMQASVEEFPQNIQEIQYYFGPADSEAKVRAVPGEGLEVPIWILGSSLYGAQLAAALGLPYAFASHFAPSSLINALEIYNDTFKPSEQQPKPYAMACINVIAADTDAEAQKLATSLYTSFLGVIRGTARHLQPPVDDMEKHWNMAEKFQVKQMLKYTFIGSAKTIEKQLQDFIDETLVDEIMVSAHIYDPEARRRSYEIINELGFKKRED